MTELEHSLIALLEASDNAPRAQDLELTQVGEELKAREDEAKALRLSLEQLHSLLESSLKSQQRLEKRLRDLESKLPKN